MPVNRRSLRLLRTLATSVGGRVDDVVRAISEAWVTAWDQLAPSWRAGVNDAINLAAQRGNWPAPWQLGQLATVANAAAQTHAEVVALAARAGNSTTAALPAIAAATTDAAPSIIAAQYQGDLDFRSRAALRIQPTALDVIQRRAQERITAATRALASEADEAVRRALVRGVATGAGPEQVARDMLARVQGAFDGGLTRALTISRTELLDAHRAVAAHTYRANADVLRGWRWHADLGRRTCAACWSMHGREFGLEVVGPAGHRSCRCVALPILRDEPAAAVTAQARFDALPAADKEAILGRSVYALYRTGAVGWADLVQRRETNGWRHSYAPTPLRDLRLRAARRSAA